MTQWILSGATMTPGPRTRRRIWRWLPAIPLLRLWAARRRERCALANLDDRLLRDIGMNRDAARRESRLPFWRP